jgi:hypothetical protein
VQGGKLGQKTAGVFESSLAEALGLIATDDKPPHLVNCLIGRFQLASGVATAGPLLLNTAELFIVGRGNNRKYKYWQRNVVPGYKVFSKTGEQAAHRSS